MGILTLHALCQTCPWKRVSCSSQLQGTEMDKSELYAGLELQHQVTQLPRDVHPLHGPYAENFEGMEELLEELFVRFEQTWAAGREQNAQLTQALRGGSVATELPNQLWNYMRKLHDTGSQAATIGLDRTEGRFRIAENKLVSILNAIGHGNTAAEWQARHGEQTTAYYRHAFEDRAVLDEFLQVVGQHTGRDKMHACLPAEIARHFVNA